MSPRREISFSQAEAEEFLAAQVHAVVVATSPDDAPLATPASVNFSDGVLVVTIPESDPIVAALTSDPRACCITEQFPSYYTIKSVIVHGAARAVPSATDDTRSFAIALEELTTFDFARLVD